MSALEIQIIPYASDNFAYAIIDNSHAVVIDPGQAGPVRQLLEQRNLALDAILLSHFHSDHARGAKELRQVMNCPIIGARERRLKPDRAVDDNQQFTVGELVFMALATPGHTRSDRCYYIPAANAVFTGDTMFVAGCGRLFEGTAGQMYESLRKIVGLGADVQVYCGHEYTLENLDFAAAVELDNPRITQKQAKVKELRLAGVPSVPSTIAEEQETNPFVRVDQQTIRNILGMENQPPEEVFAELRKRKDRF